ncbi:hypothetical protein [Streptomyces cinereoruber]|uniref:hypothetical protein n=1 Tax=Streptomyces cinereoruber TaxID=67260 RepID=UPI0036552726
MNDEKFHPDLRPDLRSAIERNAEAFPEQIIAAVLAAVTPHLEAAFHRGETAARLREQDELNGLLPCGTSAAWKRHIKRGEPACPPCRAARSEERKRWANDPAAADRAGHGKASTYSNYKCRCGPCTAAHAERAQEKRAERKSS